MAQTKISILIVLIFLVGACSGSQSTGNVVQDNEPIKIGMQVGPLSTLLMVAKDKGFFEKEGVDVELVGFTAGKFALQAMFANSLDFAASGEVPIALSALQGNEFYVVTQLVDHTKNEVRVVALKDGILDTPEEYFSKKRKLATSVGGGPEFYTYNFLKRHNITNIEIVSQKPEDMPIALESRSVDAIAIFDPQAFFAERKLGDDAITFKDDKIYSELYVLSARRNFVDSNPKVIEKITRALVLASDFVEKNPAESKAILINYTKLDGDSVDGIWNNFVFKPMFNELLLNYLNEESQWAIETGKVKEDTQIPNFRQYLYTDALRKTNPEGVKI